MLLFPLIIRALIFVVPLLVGLGIGAWLGHPYIGAGVGLACGVGAYFFFANMMVIQ